MNITATVHVHDDTTVTGWLGIEKRYGAVSFANEHGEKVDIFVDDPDHAETIAGHFMRMAVELRDAAIDEDIRIARHEDAARDDGMPEA